MNSYCFKQAARHRGSSDMLTPRRHPCQCRGISPSEKRNCKKDSPGYKAGQRYFGHHHIAKNPYCQEFLIRQMNDKTFIKEYIGIVHKVLEMTTEQ